MKRDGGTRASSFEDERSETTSIYRILLAPPLLDITCGGVTEPTRRKKRQAGLAFALAGWCQPACRKGVSGSIFSAKDIFPAESAQIVFRFGEEDK